MNLLEHKNKIALGVLVILYSVGIIGLNISEPIGLSISKATPLNLLITYLIVLYTEKNWTKKEILLHFIIAILGFFIEVIGIKTTFPFGVYTYGETLGLKVLEVPLIMGINWILLISLLSNLTSYLNFKYSRFLRALLGGFIMMCIDFLIEPFAVYYNFWTWKNNLIPISNYISWFVISSIILYCYSFFEIPKRNQYHLYILGIMILFFGIEFYICTSK